MATQETSSETQQTPTPLEDRFFGVPSTIVDKSGTDEDVEVAVVEDEEGIAPAPGTQEVGAEKPADPVEPKAGPKDEVEAHSERVQKRINALVKQREDEKRARAAAEELREEAVRYAQAANQQNRQLQQVIDTGEAELVDRVKRGAEASVAAARMGYATAYESGDSVQMIKANEALINAQAELLQANQYVDEYAWRRGQAQTQAEMAARQAQQMPPPQPPQQAPVLKPSERAQQWQEENKWFGDPTHVDMTALTYGVHETLLNNEGYTPESDEYYEELDKRVRHAFPEYFGADQSSAAPGPTSVVAPASRTNGAKPRNQVVLNSRQVRLAKRLGLTPEQYAEEVLKMERQNNG
jgi:hypothetical protein